MYVAFDKSEDGQIVLAFEPRQSSSEDEAIRAADALADEHAGAVAWSRESRPVVGDIGEPIIIFQPCSIGDFA
jgi:hypothetical protein